MLISCAKFASLNVAVLGLGKSGLAAARVLMRSGANVFAWDDNAAGREAATAENIQVEDLNHVDWSTLSALVISPGIPHTHPAPHPIAALAKDAGVALIGDVELLMNSASPAKMVAITGTNGKSTTTALLGHILSEAGLDVEVGGNLGPSIGDMRTLGADGIYVLELSSYQLELCPSAHFDISILLNITPDHLDRHGGMDGYVQAKCNIFNHQTADDLALIGGGSDIMQYIYDRQSQNPVRVFPLTVQDIKPLPNLPGEHNQQNIAAAFIAAQHLGVSEAEILSGIKSFPGLAHRLETIGAVGGVNFINDSKATNAEAAAKALACYDPIYWIAGGRAKESGLTGLKNFYPRVHRAFLIGEAADVFADELDGHVNTQKCASMKDAVQAAYKAAIEDGITGATVLLSPACASFDQFKNFEDRGDAFREAVEALRA